MKSIYAGLGLLGTGKETVEQLGRKLAKQADISEKDGEKIARQLEAQSKKAIAYVTKTMETEVSRVVDAYHRTKRDLLASSHKPTTHRKPKSTVKKAKSHAHKTKKHSA